MAVHLNFYFCRLQRVELLTEALSLVGLLVQTGPYIVISSVGTPEYDVVHLDMMLLVISFWSVPLPFN